ncbi:hypothetical protein CR513_13369, partial [Mucuna pruriens]
MLKVPIRGGRKFSSTKEILCRYIGRKNSDIILQGTVLKRRFKIFKTINDNAYLVDMPKEFGGSNTFNVIDLTPCDASVEEANLREIFRQE